MIDATLRDQILRHWEQDGKLRPRGLSWTDGMVERQAVVRPYWFLDGDDDTYCEPLESTAGDLITMAYLKRLYEFGKAAMVIADYESEHWLVAAVASYEAVIKPSPVTED